jgi:hypothetical protein
MKKLPAYFFTLLVSFSFLVLEASAYEGHAYPQKNSLLISVAFDAQGKLWRVVEKEGFIWVDASRDLGITFTKPVQVNPTIQNIGADGDARPEIAIGPEGNIYLTWTESLKNPSSGVIWFSRSIDAGKTFETPIIVQQDRAAITRRFDSLNVSQYTDAKGSVTVTWVDKRDLIVAKTEKNPDAKESHTKTPDAGAAIYFAVSTDKGASFAPEQKLADGSCECCRITLTNKPDGTVVAMWHHVFEGGERDYMMAEIPAQASLAPVLKRATFGRWKIDGCPHHGAALARGGEGKDWWGYHMAWFDGGNDESGKNARLYYARMDGEAWVSSPSKKFGNPKNQAGHPTLLSMGDKVWLVWRESEAKHNSIIGMISDDGGRSWGDAKVLATSSGKVDYPQLLSSNKQVYLVWNTEKENLQVIPL